MTTDSSIILAITTYKVLSLATGTALAWMGFKLFKEGIWGNAGDVETAFKDNKLIIKNGAPGTFFAVLGAAIVVATVVQGISFNAQYGPTDAGLAAALSATELGEPPPLDLPASKPSTSGNRTGG